MSIPLKCYSTFIVACGLFILNSGGTLSSADASQRWHFETALDAGSLEEELEQIFNSPDASPCDKDLHPIKLEMVRALKQNQTRETSTAKAPEGEEVPFGNGFLVAKKPAAPTSVHPTKHTFSWRDLYQNYKIRKRFGLIHWNELDREVRAMMSDDRIRVKHKQNLYLTPSETQLFVSMIPKIEDCFSRPECVIPAFNSEETSIASKVPYIQRGLAERDDGILYKMRADLAYFSRKPYRQIRSERHSDGKVTLKVPLINASALGVQDLSLFETLVKESWDHPHLKVDIEFLDPSKASPSLASLVFDPLKNERAYVIRKLGTDQNISLKLFSGTPFTALAHEFGHVLGLGDHYYRTWNEVNCTYTYVGFPGDIMSDHDTGKPTTEEIEWLLKTYSPQ